MKKSLTRMLARMAKDGDIETVAEFIEEMLEPEGGNPAGSADPAAVIEDPAVVVETEEGTAVVVDEATLEDVVARLDRLIELLTPAPASDEDPAEEIAEAVGEAIEAAAVAAEELPPAGGIAPSAEEVAEIVEEILEPETAAVEEILSEVLEPEGDCGDPDGNTVCSSDALRAALKAVRPVLARMPGRQRKKVCADIAARLRKPAARRASDAGVYAALGAARRRASGTPGDLGKRIMASRNANYRK